MKSRAKLARDQAVPVLTHGVHADVDVVQALVLQHPVDGLVVLLHPGAGARPLGLAIAHQDLLHARPALLARDVVALLLHVAGHALPDHLRPGNVLELLLHLPVGPHRDQQRGALGRPLEFHAVPTRLRHRSAAGYPRCNEITREKTRSLPSPPSPR